MRRPSFSLVVTALLAIGAFQKTDVPVAAVSSDAGMATTTVAPLEIPTPRWSTYWAARLDLPPNPTVPATVQQRAWTSPVWYTPAK